MARKLYEVPTYAIPTVAELKALFDQINVDCDESGESVVPLTDTEFYTDQIENIYDMPRAECERLAAELAKAV